MRKRWIVACVATAFAALPAGAQAGVHWQRIADPAPGATGLDGSVEAPPRLNFTVAAGTPYLAEIGRKPDFPLKIYRAVGNRSWRDLTPAGPLNPSGKLVGTDDLTATGGSAWIAW